MNIYVGNLSYDMSEENLRKTFEAFGEVTSASIIKDQYTGQSKGFGFVEMSDHSKATEAIEKLNGADMEGRNLKVNEARPRNDRSNSGGGGRGAGGGGGGRY